MKENWHDVLHDTIRLLEDGEITYCAAIDRIENCESFPPLSKAALIREWSLKGCP